MIIGDLSEPCMLFTPNAIYVVLDSFKLVVSRDLRF